MSKQIFRKPCNTDNTTLPSDQFQWIVIAKPLAIIMVIMYHVRLLNAASGENYVFIDEICGFLRYIHMPTFFMLSGLLLYHGRIDRGWSCASFYRDKAMRLLVPFIFCTLIGNVAQILFNNFVKHPHKVTLTTFLQSFVFAEVWPHRWFLMVLLLMMVPYFLYKKVMINKTLELLFFMIAVLIVFIPFRIDYNFLCIREFIDNFVYFFLGLLVGKYRLWQYFSARFLPFILWLSAFLFYLYAPLQPFSEKMSILVLSLLCIAAMVATSIQVVLLWPSAFSSFRNDVFQIYMYGIAFQAFVELILWRGLGCPDSLVIPFYILNIYMGIYIPVLLNRLVRKIPSRFLNLCMGNKSHSSTNNN